jgi:hypothetical protein
MCCLHEILSSPFSHSRQTDITFNGRSSKAAILYKVATGVIQIITRGTAATVMAADIPES